MGTFADLPDDAPVDLAAIFGEEAGRAIDAWVDVCAYDARLLLERLTSPDSTMPPPLTRPEAIAYIVARVHGAQRDYVGEGEEE